jgi:NhaP-type Na+/H+ or K+/H+ antiporter
MPTLNHTSDKWFPAKRYGWGWGTPYGWQGWAVVASYAVLLGSGETVFALSQHWAIFVVYAFVLSSLLVAICWRKGEKPRWRWGGS